MNTFQKFQQCHTANMTLNAILHQLNMQDIREDHQKEMAIIAETHRVSATLPIVASIATWRCNILMADL